MERQPGHVALRADAPCRHAARSSGRCLASPPPRAAPDRRARVGRRDPRPAARGPRRPGRGRGRDGGPRARSHSDGTWVARHAPGRRRVDLGGARRNADAPARRAPLRGPALAAHGHARRPGAPRAGHARARRSNRGRPGGSAAPAAGRSSRHGPGDHRPVRAGSGRALDRAPPGPTVLRRRRARHGRPPGTRPGCCVRRRERFARRGGLPGRPPGLVDAGPGHRRRRARPGGRVRLRPPRGGRVRPRAAALAGHGRIWRRRRLGGGAIAIAAAPVHGPRRVRRSALLRVRLPAPDVSGDLELTWPGKYLPDGSRAGPSRAVEPLRVIERFPGANATTAGRLVAGDNLRTLPALLVEFAGRVDLVYLDPPFGTGDAFHVRDRAGDRANRSDPGARRGPDAAARHGPAAYADREPGGLGGFIAMLAPRLELIRDLLAPTGSLYLHLDARTVHAAKLLCDEIFGAAGFRNHLVWVYAGRELARRRYNAKHDDILFYTRGRTWTFHPERILEPLRESSRRSLSRHVDEDGRPYVIRYRDGGGFAGRDEPGRTYRQLTGPGTLPRDWFMADYARKSQRTGYPTQKPEALLARLIAASSEPGDLVADLFTGSGTTPVVAAILGRRWLAGDASPAAIAATRRRLLAMPDGGGGFEVAALADAVPPPRRRN